MARKIHRSYSYTARDGSGISKHFATEAAADAWFARVGATNVKFRGLIEHDGRFWQRVQGSGK